MIIPREGLTGEYDVSRIEDPMVLAETRGEDDYDEDMGNYFWVHFVCDGFHSYVACKQFNFVSRHTFTNLTHVRKIDLLGSTVRVHVMFRMSPNRIIRLMTNYSHGDIDELIMFWNDDDVMMRAAMEYLVTMRKDPKKHAKMCKRLWRILDSCPPTQCMFEMAAFRSILDAQIEGTLFLEAIKRARLNYNAAITYNYITTSSVAIMFMEVMCLLHSSVNTRHSIIEHYSDKVGDENYFHLEHTYMTFSIIPDSEAVLTVILDSPWWSWNVFAENVLNVDTAHPIEKIIADHASSMQFLSKHATRLSAAVCARFKKLLQVN